jgi:phosphatidylserine decarboxylase
MESARKYEAMGDVMQQLRNYLSSNPDFATAFEAAFEFAKAQNIPQFTEYGIETFQDYINYYETVLTWTPSETLDGKNIYYHLCMFYFVIDLPPVKLYQTPIQPTSVPPWTWLSQWLISYANEMGNFMDTPASLTPASVATYYNAPLYHMADYPPFPGPWKTFNEFFARHINPGTRPIDSPTDPTVIVSPADATFDGSWPIDSNADVTTFDVKHLPWSIDQLLQDSVYGERFRGGIFMHSFLAPYDYHRQHAPVAGKVLEARVVPGLCYLQVVAEPDEDGNLKLTMQRELEAPDEPGYQFLQARGVIVLENPDIGLVAACPIGMAQVSSVVLSVKEGDTVQKGDEISFFQMGGSDIVVVFEAASKVNITAAQGQPYNFGMQIATAQVIPN